jgi:hypothetical protein
MHHVSMNIANSLLNSIFKFAPFSLHIVLNKSLTAEYFRDVGSLQNYEWKINQNEASFPIKKMMNIHFVKFL